MINYITYFFGILVMPCVNAIASPDLSELFESKKSFVRYAPDPIQTKVDTFEIEPDYLPEIPKYDVQRDMYYYGNSLSCKTRQQTNFIKNISLTKFGFLRYVYEYNNYTKGSITFIDLPQSNTYMINPYFPENLLDILHGKKRRRVNYSRSTETIGFQDHRTLVFNPQEIPYSINVRLEVHYSDGMMYIGSGVLVGPHHVLTAAHNICSFRDKSLPDRITVHTFSKETKVVRVYMPIKYMEKKSRIYNDISVLILDQSIGKETGWGGLLSDNDETLSQYKVHVSGYPGEEYPEFHIKTMEGYLKKINSDRLDYQIETSPGQSGGGIWVKNKNNLPLILGIHTTGHYGEGFNSGVRLSKEKILNIRSIIAESYYIAPYSDEEELTLPSVNEHIHEIVISKTDPSNNIEEDTISIEETF